MPKKASGSRDDAVPCRHRPMQGEVERVKDLLSTLADKAPDLLRDHQVSIEDYPMLLRAAVESLRGTASATTSDKRRFIEAILDYGVNRKIFHSREFVGTKGRQDYRVKLRDGTIVGIEAKGCPDGNNTTIWERPGWAKEFIVWSMCPESLANNPGKGIWSGVATRLMPKLAAEKTVVDAFIFWDGRCGSEHRHCPKQYGVGGALRAAATDIPGQEGRADWLPPPCIYLFPTSYPNIRSNPKPDLHTPDSCKFAAALLELFGVPKSKRANYVHSASIEAQGAASGSQIRIELTSRCWPDQIERRVDSGWKILRRE
ncbi:MAG: hypothetical protein KF868_06715 [Acidobacteria bacterium]|nr:hypothetical protein [Acidobacteriota bacterium]